MNEIVPRWEWRTFADDLGEAEGAIRRHPEGATREIDEYLSELIEPCPLLRAVRVHKRRTGFSIDGCTVEIAEVVADGKPGRTAAVEMEDPARVIATVRALGLDRFPNINYLRGLKGLVGMD